MLQRRRLTLIDFLCTLIERAGGVRLVCLSTMQLWSYSAEVVYRLVLVLQDLQRASCQSCDNAEGVRDGDSFQAMGPGPWGASERKDPLSELPSADAGSKSLL